MGTCYAKEEPKIQTFSSPPSDNPQKISLNKSLNKQKQEATKPSEQWSTKCVSPTSSPVQPNKNKEFHGPILTRDQRIKSFQTSDSLAVSRARPPPVTVDQLGPPQVRVEQANSKALALAKQHNTLSQDCIPQQGKQNRSLDSSPVKIQMEDMAVPLTARESNSNPMAGNQSVRGSMAYMKGYKHVNIVRQPSYLQNSIAIQRLQNPENLSKFFKSNLNLRASATSCASPASFQIVNRS